MSRIDDLIAAQCSNGIEFRASDLQIFADTALRAPVRERPHEDVGEVSDDGKTMQGTINGEGKWQAVREGT